jgi:hypothetical protein
MNANASTVDLGPPRPAISSAPPVPLRRLTTARRLPTTRAVAGALLITLAAAGAIAVGNRGAGTPTTSYVVLIKPVAPGSTITQDMVAVRAMTLPDEIAAQAYTDRTSVVGAVALGPLAAGQLVQRAETAPPASTSAGAVVGHELTIPVDPSRVPPNLRRGERVAVLATYGTSSDARTVVITQAAVVLSVGETDGGLASSRDVRLTLSLGEPEAVIEIVHASQAAEITIVRATRADEALPSMFTAATTTTARASAATTTAAPTTVTK